MRYLLLLALLIPVFGYSQTSVVKKPFDPVKTHAQINNELIGGALSLAGGSALIGVAIWASHADPDTKKLGVSPIAVVTGVIGGALVGTGIGFIAHAVYLKHKRATIPAF